LRRTRVHSFHYSAKN